MRWKMKYNDYYKVYYVVEDNEFENQIARWLTREQAQDLVNEHNRKERPSIEKLAQDPNNITVHTDQRYLNRYTARVVSRRTLLNQVHKHCDYYERNLCRECDVAKAEIGCLTAWQLTKGRGKKLY